MFNSMDWHQESIGQKKNICVHTFVCLGDSAYLCSPLISHNTKTTGKHILTLFVTLAMLCGATTTMIAQTIRGRVLDAETGETLPVVGVYYLDLPSVCSGTDSKGRFSISFRKNRTLVFSTLGYEEERVVVTKAGTDIIVRMKEKAMEMGTVTVTQKRKKYRRKENPAVTMMQKVIAARRNCDIDSLPYCTYTEYQRQTISVDKFSPTLWQLSHKHLGFMSKYATVNEHTGDTILPLLIEESVVEHSHRRNPYLESHVLKGQRTDGLTELFASGETANTMVRDVFTNVDIYEDNVRLFQLRFMSPIATHATSFYHYFINDTVEWNGKRCYELRFLPANTRDIGFSGTLHILADSSWQIQHAELNLPQSSGVNYVDRLRIDQEFDTLPGGARTLSVSDMTVSMSLVDFLAKCECRRVSRRSAFSTDSIPLSTMQMQVRHKTHPDARHRSEDFWQEARTMQMSQGEKNMHNMMDDLMRMKGFGWLRFAVQVFGENYLETSKKKSLVDIGPIKRFIAGNYVQGVRLALGAQTTGNLHRHLFADAFGGIGLKDHKPFGKAAVTWSFDTKDMRPHEFPINSITLSYSNDMMTSADRVEGHNRDNIFTVFGMSNAEHMMRQQAIRLTYDREWESGLHVTAELMHETLRPRGTLLYQPLMGSASPTADHAADISKLTNAQAQVKLRYMPGATYIVTKQRRLMANKDAPYIEISHSFAPQGCLGTNYTSNISEMEAHKRFWMYSWGRMDFWLKGGIQWNKVAFPLLLAPLTNQTFMIRRLNFNLINDFEFVNDRYAQFMWRWDMYGKLLNRIPLIRRLGWREYIGANLLWGTLTDKNNPAKSNYSDPRLWHTPGEWQGGTWKPYTQLMDNRKPYAEVYVGLTNIFNFFSVQYVHRLNYTSNPDISRWGLRFMIEASF